MNRKTKSTQRAAPKGNTSLMDELDLIHTRIKSILALTKNKGGPSDEEWEKIFGLIDLKVRLVDTELRCQSAYEQSHLKDTLKELQSDITDGKKKGRRAKQ